MNFKEIIPTPEEKPGLLSATPISTRHLILREFQLADSRDLFEIHGDARTTRYAGGTRSRTESFESLCRMINRLRETGFGTLAVQLTCEKKLIGWTGIQPLLGSDKFELIYAFKPGYWGFGYATEAGRSLLTVAFNTGSCLLDNVCALVYPQNVGSIRVLEKLGFEFVDYYFDTPTQRHACLFEVSKASFRSRGEHTSEAIA